MRLKTLSLAATMLVLGASLALGPSGAQAPSCGPADDSFAQGMRAYVLALVTKTQFASIRASLGVPSVSPSSIVPVQEESLCATAAATMNRDRRPPLEVARRVYLLKVGSVFWAEDPTRMAGEYISGLVLDSTLKVIVGRPGR
jgi:hypothetical protein